MNYTKHYKEKRVKSLQTIIDCLDNAPPNEITTNKHIKGQNEDQVLYLNGTELDALKLIKKYNLTIDRYGGYFYRRYRALPQTTLNTCCVGPDTQYGQTLYKLNINGQYVNIMKNTKTNYESQYTSLLADTLTPNDEFVILDIETTGLNPVGDDIIQICIYENEDNYILRYLPLEKNKHNNAYKFNHIDDDLLKQQSPLTQDDIDKAIAKMDLENKTVVIWTGSNNFDRVFIESYFYQHKLKGLEKIKFYNGRDLLNLDELKYHNFSSKSKNSIAKLYRIDTTHSHDALEDCRIQYQIIQNLLLKNYEPILNSRLYYNNVINEIKEFFLNNNTNSTAEELYNTLCKELTIKNGEVLEDYDKNPRTRGSEWIDIHHIDETVLDNIATRTNQAKKNKNYAELEMLSPFNKKERLVYSTKVEHFLLHCLISAITNIPSGGPHWLFGDLLKMEIGIFEETSWEHNIQENKNENFYSIINFDSLMNIYSTILNIQELSPCIVERFYKLDTYVYNKEKYDNIIKKIQIST